MLHNKNSKWQQTLIYLANFIKLLFLPLPISFIGNGRLGEELISFKAPKWKWLIKNKYILAMDMGIILLKKCKYMRNVIIMTWIRGVADI